MPDPQDPLASDQASSQSASLHSFEQDMERIPTKKPANLEQAGVEHVRSRASSRRWSVARISSVNPQDEQDGGDVEHQLTNVISRQSSQHPDRIFVQFEAGELANPRNWSFWKKGFVTANVILITLSCSLASSTYSSAIDPIAKEFNVSTQASLLGLSLFVLAFAFGPVIFSPLSEVYGRYVALIPPLLVFILFQIGVGFSKNLGTIIVCRFLGGVFASSSFSVAAGCLVDLFSPDYLAYAFAVFTTATFLGPLSGPIMAGFIVNSDQLGWRWTSWVIVIFASAIFIFASITLPETYHPVLLQRKAKRLRKKTGDQRYVAPLDLTHFSLRELATRQLLRPLIMLFTDSIILFTSLHVGVSYGVQYAILSAYPIEFQQKRGWNPGVGALPFMGVFLGIIAAVAIVVAFNPRYMRKAHANGGKAEPEERMLPMTIGGVAFPFGLFWFGWATYSEHWELQTASGIFIGIGICLIFVTFDVASYFSNGQMQTQAFLGDAFPRFAASAIAANAFLRALIAFVLSLVTDIMYSNLGVAWASSLIGFIALAMATLPFVFYRYGKRIRGNSTWAN